MCEGCEGRRASLVMGDVLRALGEMYRVEGRAVTAEGLFRSGLGKYDGAGVLKPCERGRRAACERAYGALLCEWENREREGEVMRQAASSEGDGRALLDVEGWSVLYGGKGA